MKEWKDVSSYSRGDKERIPSAWLLKAGYVRIVVHRHIHYPKDQWLLSCEPFYNNFELKNKDISKAKKSAISMVYKQLKSAIVVLR